MRKSSRILHRIATAIIVLLTIATSLSAQNPWKLYEFNGTESFRYAIKHATSDGVKEGQFSMAMTSNGTQSSATVEAALGDASCQSTMPMSSPQVLPQQMMMQCMMIAPVAMAMFTPTWAMFMGQNWEIGSKMSMGQGTDRFSFEVTSECSHASVNGVLAQITAGDVRMESCVAVDVALPLAVKYADLGRGEEIEMRLTAYTP
jgi:hypothetical protein